MKTVSMPLDEFTKEVNTANQVGKEEGFKRAFDLLIDVIQFKRMPAIGERMVPSHQALIAVLYKNGDKLREDTNDIIRSLV